MDSKTVLAKHRQFLFPCVTTYYQEPIALARAQGCRVTDEEGREYLDCFGGILTVSLSHCHPEVVEAASAQMRRLGHVSTLYPVAGQVRVAERLAAMTPGALEKCFFTNSGTEADETAVLLSKIHTGRHEIIALRHGYSGRGHLAVALCGHASWRPLPPGIAGIVHAPAPYCYRCPFGQTYPACELRCARDLEEVILTQTTGRPAAFLAEPVLGVGGFIVPPKEYFGIIRQICDKYGIVRVADEVQTGLCRTGKLYAMEHFGVAADLMTTAKSLGGGLPLGALVGKAEMMDAPQVGGLGGTYGGNPVSCAAALAVLEVVEEENLCAKAQRVGELARGRFEAMAEKYPLIGEVRGLGAMLALELVRDPKTKEPAGEEAKKMVDYCHQNGLLALNCGRYGNIIRTLMPLVISDEQLDEGLGIIEKGLALVSGK